jgi:hypothetical protein
MSCKVVRCIVGIEFVSWQAKRNAQQFLQTYRPKGYSVAAKINQNKTMWISLGMLGMS